MLSVPLKRSALNVLSLSLLLFVYAGNTLAQPGGCSAFQPPDKATLPEWLKENSHKLKKSGCWKTMTQLGEQALTQLTQQHKDREKALLSLELASSYFFLGNYGKTREMAASAESFARPEKDYPIWIKSQYLLSAANRAEGRIDEAIFDAKTALALSEKYQNDNHFLKATVLYNLGAAYSDGIAKNYSLAVQSLTQAKALFQKAGAPSQVARAAMRLAGIYHEQGQYQAAIQSVKLVNTSIDNDRDRMFYHYHLAKNLLSLKQYGQARAHAEQALKLSLSLGAEKDQQRIESLMKNMVVEGRISV